MLAFFAIQWKFIGEKKWEKRKMQDLLTLSHPNALVQSCKETFVCFANIIRPWLPNGKIDMLGVHLI
jgi:hypothetical protein